MKTKTETGYWVSDLNEYKRWNVTGFDTDRNAIAEARKSCPKVTDKYFVLNLHETKLPLEDRSQNCVFCNEMTRHFSYEYMLYALVEDIAEVLKKALTKFLVPPLFL